MAGDEQQEVKPERVALPPPTKRRDLHLRSFNSLIITLAEILKICFFFCLASVSISHIGFHSADESSPVNAFGVGLNGDTEPHHKYTNV